MRTVNTGSCSLKLLVECLKDRSSFLALFFIYVKDLPEGIRSYVSILADDAKLVANLGDVKDSETQKQDLLAPAAWRERWMMKLNLSKCLVLRMEKGIRTTSAVSWLAGKPFRGITL